MHIYIYIYAPCSKILSYPRHWNPKYNGWNSIYITKCLGTTLYRNAIYVLKIQKNNKLLLRRILKTLFPFHKYIDKIFIKLPPWHENISYSRETLYKIIFSSLRTIWLHRFVVRLPQPFVGFSFIGDGSTQQSHINKKVSSSFGKSSWSTIKKGEVYNLQT